MRRIILPLWCARLLTRSGFAIGAGLLVCSGCGGLVLHTIRVTPSPQVAATHTAPGLVGVPSLPTDAPSPAATLFGPTPPPLGPPLPTATPTPSATADAVREAIATATPEPPVETTPEPPIEATPEPTVEPTPEPTPAPRAALPLRISIPRIGVNARIVPVGEAADGSMAAPNNPYDVGWWEPGFRPGEAGSAVIGGHVDYAGYGAAVFWNLKLLRAGDPIVVAAEDGSSTTFVVSEIDSYAYNDTSVIDRVFRAVGEPQLNLITCGGTFDPRTHNYNQRIVVYAAAQ
ncbi:MAG: class F sortase [Dehalococcoidia bacterium]